MRTQSPSRPSCMPLALRIARTGIRAGRFRDAHGCAPITRSRRNPSAETPSTMSRRWLPYPDFEAGLSPIRRLDYAKKAQNDPSRATCEASRRPGDGPGIGDLLAAESPGVVTEHAAPAHGGGALERQDVARPRGTAAAHAERSRLVARDHGRSAPWGWPADSAARAFWDTRPTSLRARS
jgi:hypothetical protein